MREEMRTSKNKSRVSEWRKFRRDMTYRRDSEDPCQRAERAQFVIFGLRQ